MDLNDDLTHGMTNKVIKVHFMFENSFVSFIFENGDIWLKDIKYFLNLMNNPFVYFII